MVYSILLVAVVAIAALPGAVGAFGRHGGEGMHDFVQWRVEKMLDRVDATEEQKQKILEIAETRMEAMHALRPDHRALHEQAVSILTAEQVDRAALEAFRAEQVERLESASRTLAESLAEIAEVLEPEQRVELAKLLEEHRGHRRGHGSHH